MCFRLCREMVDKAAISSPLANYYFHIRIPLMKFLKYRNLPSFEAVTKRRGHNVVYDINWFRGCLLVGSIIIANSSAGQGIGSRPLTFCYSEHEEMESCAKFKYIICSIKVKKAIVWCYAPKRV